MSGHLDGPPPGPPDPPYIPGDLGAPSAKEFARRRASSEPRPENPYRTVHARMSPPGAAWDEGFASRQPEIDRLEAERDEARLETWRIVHKCPSCDRYFDIAIGVGIFAIFYAVVFMFVLALCRAAALSDEHLDYHED